MRADGRQRIVAGAPATLTWQGVDSSGEPADPGTVTVGVVRADGTTLLAPLTATTGSGTAPRSVAVTASQTSTLDWLTATWTSAGTVVGITVHEVVGRVYMTSAAIREAEPSLSDPQRYPLATVLAARDRTERAFEKECRRAFVPRFAVATVDERGILPAADIRSVRWAKNTSSTALTVTHNTGSRFIDIGGQAGTVGFEHGMDAPPSDLLEKFARAVRHSLTSSAVDVRAMSYTTPTGEVQRFPTPGLGPWIYGVPDIDQIIQRYRWTIPLGIA